MVRMKYRYVVVQIHSIDKEKSADKIYFSDRALYECIMKNVEKYYGDFGAASVISGLKIKYSNEKTKIAIFRIRHGPHRFITSILPLITVAAGQRTRFQTLYTGATIMQCNRFIVKYQQKFLDKMIGQFKNEEQKTKFIEKVMNIDFT